MYNFYDPVFFEAFCSEDPLNVMRKAVTTVLAGGVERFPLSRRVWTSLMFFGIGFDRLTRKLRGQTSPSRVQSRESRV